MEGPGRRPRPYPAARYGVVVQGVAPHLGPASGRLTILALNVGSVSVAMQYYVRANEGLFCFRIAFDDAYAKYKPGAMLMSMALSHLRDHATAEWVDS